MAERTGKYEMRLPYEVARALYEALADHHADVRDEKRGVWVVYYHDQGPHVESVHASELEALRQVNDGTGKHAVFVPFGSEVQEVLR